MEIKPAARPLEWAVLVYSSASPDLEEAAVRSLDEVAAARLPEGVAVGVQFGTRSGQVRYRVQDPASRQELPRSDMAEPETLRDFLAWGMKTFPARHYAVVLGGHGAGWVGAVTDERRQHMMPPDGMVEAMAKVGMRPDLVAMNCCLMAQAEVALELQGTTDFLVASQGLEKKEGLPLGRFVEDLANVHTGEEAARALAREASQTPDRTPFVSLLDLREAPRVAAALDGLGDALLSTPGAKDVIREHFAALPTFRVDRYTDPPLTDMKDAVSLANRLEEDERLRGTPIPEAAAALRAAVGRAVLDHAAPPDRPDAHGLSVYTPLKDLEETMGDLGRRTMEVYDRLRFARSTHWDEAVRWLVSPPE